MNDLTMKRGTIGEAAILDFALTGNAWTPTAVPKLPEQIHSGTVYRENLG